VSSRRCSGMLSAKMLPESRLLWPRNVPTRDGSPESKRSPKVEGVEHRRHARLPPFERLVQRALGAVDLLARVPEKFSLFCEGSAARDRGSSTRVCNASVACLSVRRRSATSGSSAPSGSSPSGRRGGRIRDACGAVRANLRRARAKGVGGIAALCSVRPYRRWRLVAPASSS
jgi:hypothetical protein